MNGLTATTPHLHEPQLALVSGDTLLEQVFPVVRDRPSLRWLQRMTKSRAIPSLKVGKLRYYKVAAVRRALDEFEIIEN